MSDWGERLSIGDVTTFLAVARCGAITAAARQMRVTPSQVSKAVARLETTMGVRLLERGSRGVALRDVGRRIVPHLERVIAELSTARAALRGAPLLTVAGPSSLVGALLPAVAGADPQVRVRGLTLSPALVRALMAEEVFDLALLSSDSDPLPPSWVRVSVGLIRKGLFAPPRLAQSLGPSPVPVAKIRPVPFVVPVYNADGRFVAGEDDCPLPVKDRTLGHEAQAVGIALELSAHTDQLVFCPVMSARPYVEAGWLVEVPVEGWRSTEPLFLACNGNRVLSRTLNRIVEVVRTCLAHPTAVPERTKGRSRSRRSAPPPKG